MVYHLQLIKLKRVIWLVEDCILLIVDRKIGLFMVKYCRTNIRLLDDYRPIVLLLKFFEFIKRLVNGSDSPHRSMSSESLNCITIYLFIRCI